MSSSVADIVADLTTAFNKQMQDGGYDPQLDQFMDSDIIPVWRDNSPEHTGEYRDSVQITKPASQGKGQVGATVGYANVIEYGSEDTPEFAPRAKTEAHFNRPTF